MFLFLVTHTEHLLIGFFEKGGHGALICALKNPGKYCSVSVFSPICNPMNCAWGRKAFQGYLGDDTSESWAQYDATELVKTYKGPLLKILIDQGDEDTFLKQGQLLPENLLASVQESNKADVVQVEYRLQQGYDHSYWFISTFIEDHFKFHFS